MGLIIRGWFPENRWALVWSILSTSTRVGSVSGSFIVGALFEQGFTDQQAFYFTSSILGAVFLIALVLLHNSPAKFGLPLPKSATDDDETLLPQPVELLDELDDSDVELAPEPPRRTIDGVYYESILHLLRACFTSGQFYVITLNIMMMTALNESEGYLTFYFLQLPHVSEGKAAIYAASLPLGSIIGNLLVGVVYDRLSIKKRGVLIALLCCGAIANCVALMTTPDSVAARFLFLFLLGACASPVYYIPESVFATSFGANYTGTLLVLIDAFGYLSAIFFDLFAGPLTKENDFPTFFAVLVVLSTGSLLWMSTFYWLQNRKIIESR